MCCTRSRCNTNWFKFIIRSLSTVRKDVKLSIFEEYRENNIDKEKYYEIAMTLDRINDQARREGFRKSYSYIINSMMLDPAQRIVLKLCLKKKKEQMQ